MKKDTFQIDVTVRIHTPDKKEAPKLKAFLKKAMVDYLKQHPESKHVANFSKTTELWDIQFND